MKTWVCMAVCWLLAGVSRSAGAYRPFEGTDAETAEPNEVELEVGPVEFVSAPAAPQLVIPAVIFNYGIARNFELVVEGRHELQFNSRPLGPKSRIVSSAFSVKEVLREGGLQGHTGLSIANEWSILLPDTGTHQRWGAETTTIFSSRWRLMTLHINVINEISTQRRYVSSVGPIIEGPFSWRIRPVMEVVLAREFGAARLNRGLFGSVLLGTIGRASDSLSLDFAVLYTRFQSAREEAMRVGFTWSFAP